MLRMNVVRRAGRMLGAVALVWMSLGSQDMKAQMRAASESQLARAGSVLEAPAPWIQEDPGSDAYAAAREALNAGRYREAVQAFQRLRTDFPRSGYVADSYYWQAFSLARLGGRSELREARDLLRTQMDRYPSASTLSDAQELMVRVEAQLARQGDSRAAAAITQQASDPCGPGQEVRAAALGALLNMNPDRALPILKQVLQDKDACSSFHP